MKAKILAENLVKGSGGHGIKQDILEHIFAQHEDKLDDLCYTFRKVFTTSGPDFFSTQKIDVQDPWQLKFTKWHHIDEPWSTDWGFDRKDAGCYIYGMFKDNVPQGEANYLDPSVIYIGESRATTRNCMLGRRTDFKGTVRNNRLSPYGCGTAFKNNFDKALIDNCYQAYLPMHSSLVKDHEMDLLVKYYKTYNKIPICNPESDLRRVLLRCK
tara:strand:+ start:2318 stop:2956 length:639 start_codon:yes stop_codon:yes gene_type:complete